MIGEWPGVEEWEALGIEEWAAEGGEVELKVLGAGVNEVGVGEEGLPGGGGVGGGGVGAKEWGEDGLKAVVASVDGVIEGEEAALFGEGEEEESQDDGEERFEEIGVGGGLCEGLDRGRWGVVAVLIEAMKQEFDGLSGLLNEGLVVDGRGGGEDEVME